MADHSRKPAKTSSLSCLLESWRAEQCGEDEENPRRPKTAPSSPRAGRKLLSCRAYKNKSFYRRQQSRMTLNSRQSAVKNRRSRPPTSHFSRPTTSNVTKETSELPQKSASSVAIVRTSGYSLHRSPGKVTMNINQDYFFGGKQAALSLAAKEEAMKEMAQTMSNVVGPLQAALEEAIQAQQGLQLEVAQLTLKLEDVKEEHSDHVKELEKEFETERNQLSKAHEIVMSELKTTHGREMDFLHKNHSEQLHSLKRYHRDEITKLEEQIDHTNDILKSTKLQMQKDAEDILEKRELELRVKHEFEMDQLRVDMKEEAKQQLAKQREALSEEHKQEIKELKDEHEEEVKVLLAQLRKLEELEEKLEESNIKIEDLEREIEVLNQELKESHLEQLKVEARLLETKEELEKFEQDFLDKVKMVENSYRDRMDALMTENTMLRRRWLNKTDEFCKYQSDIEKSQARTIRKFKDTVHLVVKARSRADMSVAYGVLEELSNSSSHHQQFDRPGSAPTTRLESLRACRQVTSSETSPPSTRRDKAEASLSVSIPKLTKQRKVRPKSCFVTPTKIT